MKFYRYEIMIHPDHVGIALGEFDLIKETPKGYWIGIRLLYSKAPKWVEKHWVSKTSRKRYAYPTKEEALIGYIKRTKRRMGILTHQIDLCRQGIAIAENMSKPNNEFDCDDCKHFPCTKAVKVKKGQCGDYSSIF